MDSILFTLYITGDSVPSQQAVGNLQAICSDIFRGECQIEVVDVLIDPGRAETERILATPTLIFRRDGKDRRIIGDLSNRRRVLEALAISDLDS